MKRNKQNITQIGNMNAAMKKWNEIASKGPDILRNKDFQNLGGIVFTHAHLKESRQTIGLMFFDEKNLQDVRILDMANKLRNRHAGILSISSLAGNEFNFEIYLVFNEEQTAIENIICVDFTVGMIYFLTEGSNLPTILKKYMNMNTPYPTEPNFFGNSQANLN